MALCDQASARCVAPALLLTMRVLQAARCIEAEAQRARVKLQTSPHTLTQ